MDKIREILDYDYRACITEERKQSKQETAWTGNDKIQDVVKTLQSNPQSLQLNWFKTD